MNRLCILYIFIFLLIPYLSCTLPDDSTIAIVNVNVVPMDSERILTDKTVLIENGIIRAIGKSDQITIPTKAISINGAGKYLMPGLAEMHAHIPTPLETLPDEWDKEAFHKWDENVLFLYVATGFTTVRNMYGDPMHLELRKRVERGELIGPRIWTSGPPISGNTVQTVEQAREIPAEQKAAGYDLIKILPGLKREVYEALYEAAKEADFWYAGHVSAEVGVPRALETGYLTIDHLDGYIEIIIADDADDLPASMFFGLTLIDYVDETKIKEAAQLTKESGVWNVPTQVLIEFMLSGKDPEEMARWHEMKYVPRPLLEHWKHVTRNFQSWPDYSQERVDRFIDIRRQLIKALNDEGAGILLGADTPQWWVVPGFALYHELRSYVESGLTPYEALKTGTTNVARFLEITDKAGTIEQGKWADMVLLSGNPLDDIANVEKVEGVIVRGTWLSKEEIEARLGEIAEMYGE